MSVRDRERTLSPYPPETLKTPTLIGIGANTLDTFYLVDEFPSHESVYESDTSVISGGGPVATALAAASFLGTKSALFDRIGTDWRGDRILAELDTYGVDTSGILRSPGAESSGATALVRRSDGARAITFTRATCEELDPSDIPGSDIADAEILHLNGRHHHASLRACEIARQHKTKISFDGGASRYRPEIRPFVERSDILILAREFAEKYTGEVSLESAADSLLASTPAEFVTITTGSQGSWTFPRSAEKFHQSAVHADPLVDTTGCGDVYHGAFLHSLIQGASLRESAACAARLAAETCRSLGGRSALTQGF